MTSLAHPSLLTELWEKYTLEAAKPDSDFFESGGDSLSAINLIVDIKTKCQTDISLENFMRNPTLAYLQEQLKHMV